MTASYYVHDSIGGTIHYCYYNVLHNENGYALYYIFGGKKYGDYFLFNKYVGRSDYVEEVERLRK